MRKAVAVVGLILLFSLSAAAQGRLEVFAGYTYANENSTDAVTFTGNGGSADIGIFPFRHFGLIADFSSGYASSFNHTQDGVTTNYNAPGTSFSYLFGPRLRYGAGPVSFYWQILGGAVSDSSIVDSNPADASKPGVNGPIPYTFAPAATSWAVQPAVGLDVRINRHWSVRAVQAGETLTGFNAVNTGSKLALQYTLTISTGIVWHP